MQLQIWSYDCGRFCDKQALDILFLSQKITFFWYFLFEQLKEYENVQPVGLISLSSNWVNLHNAIYHLVRNHQDGYPYLNLSLNVCLQKNPDTLLLFGKNYWSMNFETSRALAQQIFFKKYSTDRCSRGCSTNSFVTNSFINSLMVCENIFTPPPRCNGGKWYLQS